VTFKIGTDLDAAQVLVQNRVAIATPRLPEDGAAARRRDAQDLAGLPDGREPVSPDKSLDRAYISNYALTQLRDR
jgi:multidrug efflux pump subunit AcrB